MRDYYEILDVPRDATEEQIRTAYRFHIKAFHPDKFAAETDHARNAQRRTEEIIEAYGVLSKPHFRAEYDRFRKYTGTEHAAQSSEVVAPGRKGEAQRSRKSRFQILRNWKGIFQLRVLGPIAALIVVSLVAWLLRKQQPQDRNAASVVTTPPIAATVSPSPAPLVSKAPPSDSIAEIGVPYESPADFTKYATKLREQALLEVEPQVFVATSATEQKVVVPPTAAPVGPPTSASPLSFFKIAPNPTEEGFGIVYGADYAFGFNAPKGWMLDNESGLKQGVHAVFYPKGSTWENSVVVAYASARPKTDKIVTADDAAKFVVEEFHANGSPNYQGKRIKTVKSDSGPEAVIYYFSGDQWGNSEAVAYYVETKTINFVTLTSRDSKAFENALPAFEQLAASYTFMGELRVVPQTFVDKKSLNVVDYFLLLPRNYFEGPPADWLMFMKQPKCGLIDAVNGYMRCTGDGAQAPFEVALFRFRDGSPLVAVCSGDHSEEGKDARTGLVFLDFFRLDLDMKMQKMSRSIFPVADAGDRKGSWRFELPRYGRTVVVRSQKSGAILHKLTWNGTRFQEKK
ncbi:MAG TPA: DnaJ domain-containing protein [Chthoniobacterales bacterium]